MNKEFPSYNEEYITENYGNYDFLNNDFINHPYVQEKLKDFHWYKIINSVGLAILYKYMDFESICEFMGQKHMGYLDNEISRNKKINENINEIYNSSPEERLLLKSLFNYLNMCPRCDMKKLISELRYSLD